MSPAENMRLACSPPMKFRPVKLEKPFTLLKIPSLKTDKSNQKITNRFFYLHKYDALRYNVKNILSRFPKSEKKQQSGGGENQAGGKHVVAVYIERGS